MTPQERVFWERAQRRAAGMQPEIAAAVLIAFAIIKDSLSEAELARIVDSGDIERLFRDLLTVELLDRAFIRMRTRLRQGVEKQVPYFARDLPGGGRVDGELAVRFDYLNPRVVDAIRELDTKVITTLTDGVRETVRAHVEHGLEDGLAPRTIAKGLREVIGLAPNQEEAVRNFEKALRGEGRNPLDYKLRDRRFDRTIRKGQLTEAQIDTQVAAYRRKMVAFNANTNARTAALDAMKLGQKLSWDDAVAKGIVDPDRLEKTWIAVGGPEGDGRNRPAHLRMHGQTVRYDEPYANGQMIPGESEFNCRCISRFAQRRA